MKDVGSRAKESESNVAFRVEEVYSSGFRSQG